VGTNSLDIILFKNSILTFPRNLHLFFSGNLAPSITEEQLTDVMTQFGEKCMVADACEGLLVTVQPKQKLDEICNHVLPFFVSSA
jgi:RNA recognition motif-containing protein